VTEYELRDLQISLTSVGIAEFVAFVTIVSGYLAVAYLVGNKLSRSQLIVINFLYLFVAAVVIFTLYAMMNEFQSISVRLQELNQSQVRRIPSWYPGLNLVMCSAIVIASLKFMLDLRKLKQD